MYWLILCNDCTEELDKDSIADIFQAKYGMVDHEDMEGAVLSCCEWSERAKDNVPVMQFFCDECGRAVAVDESSRWFVDAHRKERDEQIGRA